MGRSAIPEDIKKGALKRLKKHVEKQYIGRYGVKDVITKFKGRYLYVDWVEGFTDDEIKKVTATLKERFDDSELIGASESVVKTLLGNRYKPPKPSKLCRLRYAGDIDSWELEIYKYSDNWYDTEGDFLYGGGTVEECFDAAASLYITETFH